MYSTYLASPCWHQASHSDTPEAASCRVKIGMIQIAIIKVINADRSKPSFGTEKTAKQEKRDGGKWRNRINSNGASLEMIKVIN